MSKIFCLSYPRRALALVGFFAAVAANESAAQTVTPVNKPLTLAQALARTSERSLALAAQRFDERAADGLVEQAALRPNPTLDVAMENFLGTGRVGGFDGMEATVQAGQTFERGGKLEKRVALASREREIATREFAVRRTAILSAAANAYVAALAAQQRLALAGEPVRLARETLALIDSRVRAGAASVIDSARARVAVISAEGEFARTEAALVSARAALAAMWGGGLAEVTGLTGTLRVPDALPSEAEFRARLATHPRLEQQAAVIASRRASLDLEQAQAKQDVTASGGVRFLRDGTDAAFVAGVSVPLPTRNKNQGNIRAARETLAGAEHTVRAITAELHAAFTAAWQELAAAHALAQKLRREALPATEEAHTAVRRAYEAGQLPLIDVLDAQRALVALRREILAAEFDYAAALVRLDALTDPAFTATTVLLALP